MTDNRTTELTASELVKALLDERGADYLMRQSVTNGSMDYYNRYTVFIDGNPRASIDTGNGDEVVLTLRCTPEQAIAVTLGRQKVKKVRGLTYNEHGNEVYFLACSGCGDWVDGDLDCIGEADGPNFCHNCGGEFDGPLLCRVCGKLADMEFGDMCAECYWYEGEGNDER